MNKTIKYKIVVEGFGPTECKNKDELRAKLISFTSLFNHTKENRWKINKVIKAE